MSEREKAKIHQGADNSAPYPVSRLAPAFHTDDLAAEVAKAENMLGARTSAKLRVIADQILALQTEARKILDQAREEQTLNHAQCAFKRIPGKIYYLYEKADGSTLFSMLSPEDWGASPPHAFLGSYRLEADYSWTPAQQAETTDRTGEVVEQLLRIGLSS